MCDPFRSEAAAGFPLIDSITRETLTGKGGEYDCRPRRGGSAKEDRGGKHKGESTTP